MPSARLGAFPGVARMGGNVPAVLVCGCQATVNYEIFAVHLVAQEKGQNITHLKNIFSVFFGADKCAY